MSVGPLVQPPQSLNRLRLNLVLPAGPYWSNILTVKLNLIVSVMAHCTKTCITRKILNYGPKLWKGNIFACLQYLAKFNENWFVTLITIKCTNGLSTRLLFTRRPMWLVHGLKMFHSNGINKPITVCSVSKSILPACHFMYCICNIPPLHHAS